MNGKIFSKGANTTMQNERRKLKIRPKITNKGGQEYETTQPIPDVFVEEGSYFPEPPQSYPARRRPYRQSWEIEAVEEPKKNRVKKAKEAKKKKPRSPLFGNISKKDKSQKTDGLPSEQLGSKKAKKKIQFPWQKEKQPDITPLESGAVTVPDLLAPASADFTNRDYVIVDGTYHTYLYITGYGYTTIVGNGWLNPLIEAGEDTNINFYIRRQPKDKILSSIAKTTMINRSRMRDVGDTRQDYEELDSAISSGLYLKESINRNGEDFYYMHTLIEVVAGDLVLC